MVAASRTVHCRCNGQEIAGTYDVDGRFLVLTSPLGVRKTSLGLQDPRKLAVRLLRNICRMRTCPVPPPDVAAPGLEAVDAMAPAQTTV